MSRAFVKEIDDAPPEAPPELPISGHPNLVTRSGLEMIDARLAAIEAALAGNPADAEAARLRRDQRYWTSRRATGQVTQPAPGSSQVAFGSRVTVKRDGRPAELLEIVGEDEADPAKGRLSYVSPLAAALIGAEAGEVVEVGPREPPISVQIIAVDNG